MIIIGTLKVTRNIVLEYQMAPKCITLCFWKCISCKKEMYLGLLD
jgi:hypothetical protein